MGKFEEVEQRLEEVKQDYGVISSKDLEKKYNVSYSTICRVLKRNGIIKDNLEKVKYKYLREHEKEFAKDWEDGLLTQQELVEKYKCPKSVLKSKARDIGVKRKKVEKFNVNDLINDWNNKQMSNKEICEKYKISVSKLFVILRKNNIEDVGKRYGRKYFFNEYYFDVIDTEEKAYWLGFIYADGCHNEKKYSLSITLKMEDKSLLEKFYKCIEHNGEVKSRYNKKYDKYYCNVYVDHPHMSKALLDKGVMTNKSFKIRFPSDDIVPDYLKRHFIRGYFDGDGCISMPSNISKTTISITSNYQFLKEMKIFIESNIDNYKLNMNDENYTDIYRLHKAGVIQVERFLNWLYKDSTIHLERKYNLYLKLLQNNKMKGYSEFNEEQNKKIG